MSHNDFDDENSSPDISELFAKELETDYYGSFADFQKMRKELFLKNNKISTRPTVDMKHDILNYIKHIQWAPSMLMVLKWAGV
ncbi:hypothetical protein AGMMS49949_03200 [Alphaproteobacteria bacterium]|nr:hypothetical protein AGMMS49949_03200 [Alphaproteobacteria bacterium]GHS97365.1 hypothetical protein AGMMS50296_4290 [Alphaproteobacteria bacterium]